MYIYEISDILFFIKSLKTPTGKLNILNYVSFNTGSTRSSGIKLHHKTAHTNAAMNSYFFRLPRLWNSLPIIDHTSRHTIVCRAAQEAGAPHREYIDRKNENVIFRWGLFYGTERNDGLNCGMECFLRLKLAAYHCCTSYQWHFQQVIKRTPRKIKRI